MSNFMKNARSWLGLGHDPYYDAEYGDPPLDDEWTEDDDEDDVVDVTPAPTAARPRSTASSTRRTSSGATVRPIAAAPEVEEDGGVRVISSAAGSGPEADGSRGVVRPLPSVARPHVVTPRSFNDVQEVADTFKRNQPVILNLQGVDRDLSRRLIDFGSGLCYGLEGDMERVTDQVFLLTPHGAEVSDDDRRRIREGVLAAGDR